MIRRATMDDLGCVIEMARRFVSESEYRDFVGVKPAKLTETITALVSTPVGAIFLSGSDGCVTGMLAAVLYEHPFSGDLTASELAWWVEPKARTAGDGIRLLRAAEEWAKESGATRMQMVSPNQGVAEIYKRLGYKAMETAFQRSLV